MKLSGGALINETRLQWTDNKEDNPFNYYADYSFKTAFVAFYLVTQRHTCYIAELKIEIDGKTVKVFVYPIAEFYVAVFETENKVYVTRLLYNNASVKSIIKACGRAYEYHTAMNNKKDGFCCQPARLATLKEKNKNSHSTPRRLYISVPKVAELIGVAYQTLCLYENQEVKPRMDKIKALAEVYKCDIEDLFKNDEISYKTLQFLKYVGTEKYCNINIEEELKNRQSIKRNSSDYFKSLCYYD